jgi:ABC-type amino acid transport substrate-binding protein
MAHRLAQEMKVSLELVRIDRAKLEVMLNEGYVDLVMSGLVVTLDRARDTTLSNSYLDQTLAFIVRDHRREEFSSRSAVQKLQKIRLGVPNTPYYMTKIREYLPHAEIVVLDSPRQFFSGEKQDLDGMAYSAEAGSAWTLIYPAYSVVIPRPDILAVPSAYAVARGERELIAFINTWIELKKKDQTVEALYDHWILGRSRAAVEPRWSVIRNVLHLVK